MSDSPEHECRQGRHCKARIRDADSRWHGAGVERPDSLCRPCEEAAFADIRQLGDDRALLLVARTQPHAVNGSGPKVSGSSERPVPISLPADALITAIDEEAARWARRLPGDGDDLTVICSNLGTLVDLPPQTMTVWVPLPDGGDDVTETVLDGVKGILRLSRLHHRAVGVLGLAEPKDEWLKEPCHICGLMMVTTSPRTDLVTCRNPECRNVWDQDEFARLNNPLLAA